MGAEPLVGSGFKIDRRLLCGVLEVPGGVGLGCAGVGCWPWRSLARSVVASRGVSAQGSQDLVHGAVTAIAFGQRTLPSDVVDEGHPCRGDPSSERRQLRRGDLLVMLGPGAEPPPMSFVAQARVVVEELLRRRAEGADVAVLEGPVGRWRVLHGLVVLAPALLAAGLRRGVVVPGGGLGHLGGRHCPRRCRRLRRVLRLQGVRWVCCRAPRERRAGLLHHRGVFGADVDDVAVGS